MQEITMGEIKKQGRKKDAAYLKKVHLLANGMVKVHGYNKEKAIALANNAAYDWFDNDGQYSVKS